MDLRSKLSGHFGQLSLKPQVTKPRPLTALTRQGEPTMRYPAWQPGEIPWDLSIFPSPSWTHLLPPFPALERPLHVALPCIGLDGVSHGLAALNAPFQVDYAFDTLGCLRQPLATIHGANAASFNLGPQEGISCRRMC